MLPQHGSSHSRVSVHAMMDSILEPHCLRGRTRGVDDVPPALTNRVVFGSIWIWATGFGSAPVDPKLKIPPADLVRDVGPRSRWQRARWRQGNAVGLLTTRVAQGSLPRQSVPDVAVC
jgi:hypothetical protein